MKEKDIKAEETQGVEAAEKELNKKVQLMVKEIIELSDNKQLLEQWQKLVAQPDVKANEAIKMARYLIKQMAIEV